MENPLKELLLVSQILNRINSLGDVRSILLENQCINTSKMFKFMHQQTHDPETRFDKAIKFFSSEYYNTPKNFDGSFTATFNNKSTLC